jgi:hypothetical protein
MLVFRENGKEKIKTDNNNKQQQMHKKKDFKKVNT